MDAPQPTAVDLKRDERLKLTWQDGTESSLAVSLLRHHCPCANCKIARDGIDPHRLMRPATPEELGEKPKKKSIRLGVVPTSVTTGGPVAVERAELMGNYAIKLFFTDGHDSGIYTWKYLKSLA